MFYDEQFYLPYKNTDSRRFINGIRERRVHTPLHEVISQSFSPAIILIGLLLASWLNLQTLTLTSKSAVFPCELLSSEAVVTGKNSQKRYYSETPISKNRDYSRKEWWWLTINFESTGDFCLYDLQSHTNKCFYKQMHSFNWFKNHKRLEAELNKSIYEINDGKSKYIWHFGHICLRIFRWSLKNAWHCYVQFLSSNLTVKKINAKWVTYRQLISES